MATLRFFRDSLPVDDTLFERLAKSGLETHPGDTLVLGAASCTLTSLSPAVSYVILVSRPPGKDRPLSHCPWGSMGVAASERVTGPAGEPLLNVDGLATRLGVSARFVRRLVEERRVPLVKLGRLVRFDPVEVEAWIRASQVAPHRAPVRGSWSLTSRPRVERRITCDG